MYKFGVRFVVFLLILFLLSGSTAFAELMDTLPIEELPAQKHCGLLQTGTELEVTETLERASMLLLSDQPKTLVQTVEDGCFHREEFIDVQQYRITKLEMRRWFYNFSMLHPELFMATSYGFISENKITLDGSPDIIAFLAPIYLCTKEELPAKQEKLRQDIALYTDLAKTYPTKLEGLLAIHDKLVMSCVYDSKVADKVGTEETLTVMDYFSAHADGLLSNGKAICQGYAQAFYLIAKELGYEVNYCYNNNHIWNYIKFDDQWYHMDVTWNDPVPDIPDIAHHRYFLCSDSVMNDHAPSQWVSPLASLPQCNSTKYEKGYLFNFPAGIKIEKNDGYYQFNYSDYTFYSSRLMSEVMVTKPENGMISYGYLKEPDIPMAIFSQCKDDRGVGNIQHTVRNGETMYDNKSFAIYGYLLPQKPANTQSSKVYFWDSETLLPCGPVLEF